jgi:glycosyltransferase involved in cell wall biosynthesis
MIFLMLIFKYYIINNINIITNTNINKNNYTEIIETEKDINNNEVKIDKSKRNNLTQNNLSSLNETEDKLDEKDLVHLEKEDLKNMTNIIKKANEYIILCEKGILQREIKLSNAKPKITALTASYNSEKTIKAAIRSIQNQKMTEIEILIVDDASTDNSLAIIEDLQKEDKRIRIIKNKENSGPLFSKSIGALSAKGKYIMQLDSDDLFINENIFSICYNEAEKNNIDILEFSGFRSKSRILKITKYPNVPRYLKNKNINLIITQPRLSSFIYRKIKRKSYKLIDGYLWGKCIKSEIYKKSLDILGENIYKQKIYYGDDRIVNFVLFRVAYSFKFIKEYGIVYYDSPHSILNSSHQIRNCHDELINIRSIFNFTKNSSNVIFAVSELKYRWNTLIKPGLNIDNSKYAKDLINQMLECN